LIFCAPWAFAIWSADAPSSSNAQPSTWGCMIWRERVHIIGDLYSRVSLEGIRYCRMLLADLIATQAAWVWVGCVQADHGGCRCPSVRVNAHTSMQTKIYKVGTHGNQSGAIRVRCRTQHMCTCVHSHRHVRLTHNTTRADAQCLSRSCSESHSSQLGSKAIFGIIDIVGLILGGLALAAQAPLLLRQEWTLSSWACTGAAPALLRLI
jgi:hypothetical protein